MFRWSFLSRDQGSRDGLGLLDRGIKFNLALTKLMVKFSVGINFLLVKSVDFFCHVTKIITKEKLVPTKIITNKVFTGYLQFEYSIFMLIRSADRIFDLEILVQL